MAQRIAQIQGHLGAPLTGQLLKGEVAIITGAGQGIGKATALLFGAHGAHVVVSDIDAKKGEQTAKEIKDAGGTAIAFPGDVTTKTFGEDCVKATVEAYGTIHHIVNNAGFTADKMIHTMDDETFQLMIDVHCVGPFRLVRAAAPYFRIKDESKRGNRSIVNLSSTSGTHGNVGQLNYSTAKAGVTGFTKTLAKEWGPFGVRANTVAPGWVDTRLTRAKEAGETITVNGRTIALGIPGRPTGPAAASGPSVAAVADIPLRRPGQAEELAGAILFLCSPLASYVSGQTLEVTGGRGI